ncbi:MAG: hypothetical protein DRG66_05805 [Deltaproteobacteria bacterium]|nr:MAG: hypothetical protein DRG66_05805 [Deltaproteobacteria bacterium]
MKAKGIEPSLNPTRIFPVLLMRSMVSSASATLPKSVMAKMKQNAKIKFFLIISPPLDCFMIVTIAHLLFEYYHPLFLSKSKLTIKCWKGFVKLIS